MTFLNPCPFFTCLLQSSITASFTIKLVIDYLDHCSLCNSKFISNDSGINKKPHNFKNAPPILCLPNELINPEGNTRWVPSAVKLKIGYEESLASFWLFADELPSLKDT